MTRPHTATLVSIFPAVFQLLLGVIFAFYAVAFRNERCEVDLVALCACLMFAMAWSLVLRRKWGVLAQLLIFICLVKAFPDPPLPQGPHDLRPAFHQLLAFLLLGGIGLYQFAYLILFFLQLKDSHSPASAPRSTALMLVEIGYLLLSCGAVYIGDSVWIDQAKMAKDERIRYQEVEQRNRILFKVENQLNSLQSAQQSGSQEEIRRALSDIDEYAANLHSDYLDILEQCVQKAGPFTQSLLVESIIRGDLKPSQLIEVFEKLNLGPEISQRVRIARHRKTIFEMRRSNDLFPGGVWLDGVRSHERADLVARLADAMSDQANTTVLERLQLGKVLANASGMPEFDLRPVLDLLTEIEKGDADEKVRQAATYVIKRVRRA